MRLCSRSVRGGVVTEVIVIAVLYCGVAILSLRLAFEKTNASPVWPPSGIALVALLLLGYRVWPGITLGAFLANVVTFLTNQVADVRTIVAVSSVIGFGNTLEAVVGRFLFDRWAGARSPFNRAQDVFTFTVVALLACLVSPAIGPTVITLAGLAPSGGYGTIWFTWWLGDATGVLLVAALLITWSTSPPRRWTLRTRIEGALLFVSLVIAVHVGFGDWLFDGNSRYPLTFVPLPWLVWSALRFGPREAAMAVAVTSGIAVWHTVNGHGPFVRDTINESLLLSQAFVGTFTVTILAMAAVVAERHEAQARLRTAHDTLEARVDERTRELVQVNHMLQAEVAERKRAEETAEGMSRQHELILAAAGDGIFGQDADGLATFINPAAAAMLGWSPEELVGQPMHALIHHSRRDATPYPRTECPIYRAFRDGTGQHREHEVFWRRDGTGFPVEYTSTPIRGDDGRVIGSVVAFRDIGEREQLEAQIRQAQKMEAIGRLAGGIAHDFNNLLTVIKGRSELLRHRLQPGPIHSGDFDLIKRTADRASALIGQLLAFSRQQVLEPQVLDLNAVVYEMSTMLQRLIGEQIELHTLTDAALGRVKADLVQIEQVIVNLAVNARDAMPEGGRLTLRTANVELDGAFVLQHPGARSGAHVLLAVSDTGAGMDADTQARVFEPFFTTKGPGKGSGFGLSTAYGIIEQSDGYIAVESAPGRGSTFTIYLPRVEEVDRPSAPTTASPVFLHRPATILVVDDEDEVREVTRDLLVEWGHIVLEAADGPEALRLCEEHHGPIDLLLTDVVMPGMTGVELGRRVTRLRPNSRTLYMSGYVDTEMVRVAIRDVGGDFLAKPFARDALLAKVEAVLEVPRR